MYACIDIGGTSIKFAIIEKNGEIIHREEILVLEIYNNFVVNIINWINSIKNKYLIKGVCISSPGAVDTKSGIVHGSSALDSIHNINWKEIIKLKTGLLSSIENDANCSALSEYYFGKAKNITDVVFIVCGTGIGGAILKDGVIHKGKHLHGGEFGYMIMEEIDGIYNTFSDIASTMSLVRKIRKYYNDDFIDGINVFERAENGDKVCQGAIEIFYKNLAKGIFNIQYSYDPELIVLSGSISNRHDFINKIDEQIDILLSKISIAKIKPTICSSTHKRDSNLLGALVHFLSEYEKP